MSGQGSGESEGMIWARLSRLQSLRGLRGQQLGTVGWCAVDLASGRIEAVELRTPWQTITIPWARVGLDDGEADLQLLAENVPDEPQESSD